MRPLAIFVAGLLLGLVVGHFTGRTTITIEPGEFSPLLQHARDSGERFEQWKQAHPDEFQAMERGELPPERALELTREWGWAP